jgi:hypothetical protein
VAVPRLAALALVVLALTVPTVASGASTSDLASPHLVDLGSLLSLGFGVTPLRPQLPAPLPGAQVSDPGRPIDPDTEGSALSLDLTLRWPGSESSPLEPYVAVGPAVFVVEPDYAGRLLGTRVDPSLRLGARAGAGVNWKLGRDLTLFGAYEVTTAADGALSSGARAADHGVSGYDFTYGLRLRF